MKKKLIALLIIVMISFVGLVPAGYAGVSQPTTEEVVITAIKKVELTTVERKGSGKTTVRWKKVSGVAGYEIQYSTKSNYSNPKSVTVTKAATVSKAISGLSKSSDTYIRVRAYKKVNGEKQYGGWSASAKLVVWKSSWKYAGNSKIHSDPAILYYTSAAKKKNKTIAINAGHGTKGGSSKQTLCHPDGSAKVTGGSTSSGSKYATSINEGTTMKGGASEASVNLKIVKKLKTKLLAEGYNVLVLRETSDAQLDNIARTLMANNNANAHIAIHFDSTRSNKGAFYISVPNVSSYRNMEPVKSHWRQHNALGSKLIAGMKSAGVKIWSSGSLALDLTQTSYSTIPSVDLEVGDEATSTSDSNLDKMVKGIVKGINNYY